MRRIKSPLWWTFRWRWCDLNISPTRFQLGIAWSPSAGGHGDWLLNIGFGPVWLCIGKRVVYESEVAAFYGGAR